MNPTTTTPELDEVLIANARYGALGFATVAIQPGEKRPTGPKAKGWTTRTARPDEFGDGFNLGIQTGSISDGGKPGYSLVCIDLDSAEAVARADEYLPETGMIDGRPGKPRSHRWYLVPNSSIPADHVSAAPEATAAADAAGRHRGPKTTQLRRPDKKCVVEIRGTGSQALVPPSVWTSSDGQHAEPREWEGGQAGAPAVVDYTTLFAAVSALAEACGVRPRSGVGVVWVDPEPDAHEPSSSRAPHDTSEANDTATPTVAIGTPGPRRSVSGCDLYRQAENRGTVTIDGRTYPFADRVSWAERYFDPIPDTDLSRSEQGGQDVLFRVVRVLTNDFLVRDVDVLTELVGRYNVRLLAFRDEWSAAEVAHKIKSALEAPPTDAFPPGCKLPRADAPPLAWDDPARLAGEFLADTQVRFLSKLPLVYVDGCYRPTTRNELAARVRVFAERAAAAEFARLHRRHAEKVADAERRERAADAPNVQPEHAEFQRAKAKADKTALAKEASKLPTSAPKVSAAAVSGTVESVHGRRVLPSTIQPGDWLDGSGRPPMLSVGNGLLDPDTLALIPHTPDYFVTCSLPVAYDPTAAVPVVWLGALAEVMEGDADRIAILQEMFGACLDPHFVVKFFGLLVGNGDTGKSMFAAGLRAVLGDANCSAVPLNDLTGDRGGFAAYDLLGKLANIVPDQPYFESGDESMMKGLTGGDLCKLEPKGHGSIFVRNTAKLIFGCNNAPTFADKTDAVWNRMQAVPFDWVVPADRKNPRMNTPEFWRPEASGILNWGLAGLARLKSQRRFTRSARCDALKAKLIEASNPLREFLTDTYRPDPDGFVPYGSLVVAYDDWKRDNGVSRSIDGKTVNAIMAQVYPPPLVVPGKPMVNGKQVRGYVGLAPASGTARDSSGTAKAG